MKKSATHSITRPLLSGDRIALAKAITLAESASPKHEKEARKIFDEILPYTGNSIRIGITGVPGVGKSTFIEALGKYVIKDKQRKVAVLAIDPTSAKSKGSILGDKTRMEHLARSENAFIRPSPSSGALGGVAGRTREAILLCEAAGYNVIFVETVGVGQSETAVHALVDFMLLLLLPGAGDELQGMKRGIVELADLLAINKADGDNLQKVKQAQFAYKQALHLFPPSGKGWQPDVLACSALTGSGITEIWNTLEKFESSAKRSGSLFHYRNEQNVSWLKEQLMNLLLKKITGHKLMKKRLPQLEKKVGKGEMSVFSAINELEKILMND